MNLAINGSTHAVDCPGDMPLLSGDPGRARHDVRQFGRGIGQCGSCPVHVDGAAVRSRLLLVGTPGNGKVVTIEVIGDTVVGAKVEAPLSNLNKARLLTLRNRKLSKCGLILTHLQ